jgi:hypothetical protein
MTSVELLFLLHRTIPWFSLRQLFLCSSSKPFQIGDMFGGQDENADDMETVIDKEVCSLT